MALESMEASHHVIRMPSENFVNPPENRYPQARRLDILDPICPSLVDGAVHVCTPCAKRYAMLHNLFFAPFYCIIHHPSL